MIATSDLHVPAPVRPGATGGLRDMALALCLTALAAIALDAHRGGALPAPAQDAVVTDWKGNGGSLPGAAR